MCLQIAQWELLRVKRPLSDIKHWPWVLHYSWFEIKFSKTSSNSQLSRNIRHAPLTFFRASFFSSFAIQKTKMESFVECSVGGVSVDEWLIQRVTSSSTICAYFYGWWEKIEIVKKSKMVRQEQKLKFTLRLKINICTEWNET